MELDCVSPLMSLLKSSSPESAITLLSTLSAHPPNNVRRATQSGDCLGCLICDTVGSFGFSSLNV